MATMSVNSQHAEMFSLQPARCLRRQATSRIVPVTVVGLLLVGGAAATPLRAQSDERAVLAVATHFFDGMRSRDTAMMRSTVIPSTMLVIPGGVGGFEHPMPISQFIASAGKGTGPGGDEQMKDPAVRIDGALASVWAYYTYTAGGTTKIDHCGIDSFLLQKEATGWKIFNIAGTIRTTGCTPITR